MDLSLHCALVSAFLVSSVPCIAEDQSPAHGANLVAGQLEIVARSAAPSGWRDGSADKALFEGIGAMVMTPAGILRILDYGSGKSRGVRELDPAGQVHTLTARGWNVEQTQLVQAWGGRTDGTFLFVPKELGAAAPSLLEIGPTLDGRRVFSLSAGSRRTVEYGDPVRGDWRTVVKDGAIPYSRTGWHGGLPPSLMLARLDQRRIVIADEGSHALYALDSRTMRLRRLAGTSEIAGVVDGAGAKARITAPAWLGIDEQGRVLFVDSGSAWLRQIHPDGRIESIAAFPVTSPPSRGCGQGSFSIIAATRDTAGRAWVGTGDGEVYVQHGRTMVLAAGRSGAASSEPGPLPGALGPITGLVAGFAGDIFVISRDAVSHIALAAETSRGSVGQQSAADVSHVVAPNSTPSKSHCG